MAAIAGCGVSDLVWTGFKGPNRRAHVRVVRDRDQRRDGGGGDYVVPARGLSADQRQIIAGMSDIELEKLVGEGGAELLDEINRLRREAKGQTA
jgi:hypothetical protein